MLRWDCQRKLLMASMTFCSQLTKHLFFVLFFCEGGRFQSQFGAESMRYVGVFFILIPMRAYFSYFKDEINICLFLNISKTLFVHRSKNAPNVHFSFQGPECLFLEGNTCLLLNNRSCLQPAARLCWAVLVASSAW